MVTNNQIVVSVQCYTYNHANYIRQCLDSLLMQKTNFNYEIIVHDDASNDGTEDIVREYASQYPNIIIPIYEEENQYQKHDYTIGKKMELASRGKYVAICEGDDYWTDANKLQKQVDFLENNPNYVLCHHNMYYETDGKKIIRDSASIPKSQTLLELAQQNFIQTATVLYKVPPYNLVPDSLFDRPIYAHFLFMRVCEQGDVYYMDEPMSVYRLHSGGIFSQKSFARQFEMTSDNIGLMVRWYKGKNDKVLIALKKRLRRSCLQYAFAAIKRLNFIDAVKILTYYNKNNF